MRRALAEEVKRSLRTDFIRIFKENERVLREAGWIVTDEKSPRWWDGVESIDELLISSILVQMTKWETVKRILQKMREKGVNSLERLAELSEEEIGELIRQANFYKTKAKRLKSLASLASSIGVEKLVKDEGMLKEIEGIGDETAEAILLFAGNVPVFPRSNYAKKVLSRVLGIELSKEEAKELIEELFGKDLFNLKLVHAGIVTVGKLYCFSKPKCNSCVFKELCKYYTVSRNETV
ncbi:endonuclease III domain-containing protein [Stygiolobus caldivivus]|uniref:DNA endonuclease III n=1 Tax=Stygiolobus caldivivus TaxID=2824673 RepID=A0A8D5U6N9_9CREN|nr:endonuclease III domain-containing protein [Stygiolobus caldivivus]BCU70227.1 DNA endonuclease III [Stygiolobus caldivivus]